MKRSEYEKLCDEAFGKPEKRNLLKMLKMRPKLVACVSAVLILTFSVLAVALLRTPDLYVHREVQKPMLLKIAGQNETSLTGMDIQGKSWLVHCDTTTLFGKTLWCWITFEGEPSVIKHMGGSGITYEVTATRCWDKLFDDRMYVGYGDDICEFDIDRDGVVEQCILGGGITSGIPSFELSVWNGATCEERIFLAPNEYYYLLAFYTDGQELKIAGLKKDDGALYEDSLDVVYMDGKLEVLSEGETMKALPEPAM